MKNLGLLMDAAEQECDRSYDGMLSFPFKYSLMNINVDLMSIALMWRHPETTGYREETRLQREHTRCRTAIRDAERECLIAFE